MRLTIKKHPNSLAADDMPLIGADVQVFLDDYELTGKGLTSLDLRIREGEFVLVAIEMEAGSIAIDEEVLARFIATIQEKKATDDSSTPED